MLAYIVSGLIFAIISFLNRENFKLRCALYANIVAGVLTVLLYTLFFLDITGNSLIDGIFTSVFFSLLIDWKLMSFVFGYTLYTSIKAIVIYKKQIE